MDFLTAMILENMAEGGPEAVAEMFAVSLVLDLFLLMWCMLMTLGTSSRGR